MGWKIWNDGGEFDELLQKHVRNAVTEYVQDGFIAMDPGSLEIIFIASDPMDSLEKRVGLADLIDDRLRDFVPGNVAESVDILNFEFGNDEEDRAGLVKLQACLRILRGA